MQKIQKLVFENGHMHALISKVITDPDTGEEHIVGTHHANIDPTDPNQVIEFGVKDGQPISQPMPVAEVFGQVTAQAVSAKVTAEAERDTAKAERKAERKARKRAERERDEALSEAKALSDLVAT